ncbi:MAG: ABC transporter substrate-binding protein [Gammaproteobacteria bacterium]|nr:ABC transporter substrate-binding protein [Gammaproteobacteria bacterium]
MFKRFMKKFVLIAAAFCFASAVLAAEPAPLSVVRTTTNRMLSSLRANKSKLHNRKVIRNIVRRIVVPVMDVHAISRSVVGRRYWYQSSSSLRSSFVVEFTKYVTDMYSSALSSYSNEKISFRPIRSFSSNMQRVRVYSVITRPGAPAITLNYRLVRHGSAWKIYDFSVDGVSMVQSYRSQFASTLNKGGLALLVKKLKVRG